MVCARTAAAQAGTAEGGSEKEDMACGQGVTRMRVKACMHKHTCIHTHEYTMHDAYMHTNTRKHART